MNEYIEREALIDFCKKIIHERWNETTAPVSWSHAYADFIDDINNQPAADDDDILSSMIEAFLKKINMSFEEVE